MTLVLATTHLASLTPHLPVFLASSTADITAGFKPLVADTITVMQILLPLIAVFRIVYRFAEHRDGNMTVLIAEVVLIIFVALVLGTVLQTVVKNL
jgi:hypothetical protein